VLRLLSRIILGEPSEAVSNVKDARALRFAPMAILAFTIMFVGIFPANLYQTITSAVAPLVDKLGG
jgi:NADH:ubiquinone oxidoreductase subunit 4 (subunit M)